MGALDHASQTGSSVGLTDSASDDLIWYVKLQWWSSKILYTSTLFTLKWRLSAALGPQCFVIYPIFVLRAKLCWHQSSTSNAILSNLVFSFSHLTRFCTLAYDDLRYLLSFSLFFCTVIYYQRFTILTKKWGCCWTNPQKNFTILSNFVLGFSDFNFNSFAFDPYPKVLVSICVT